MEMDALGLTAENGIEQPEPFAELLDAFGAHTWVYACANLVANSFASIEFLPYIETRDGAWDVNERHPFFNLLKNPNPHMSGVEFRRSLSLASKLTGNAYIILEPENTKKPTELWPLQANRVEVIPDRQNFIGGYKYTINGHSRTFSADRVIHFREASPTSLQYGQGALSAVKNAVMSDLYADSWNRYFFANAARPDAVLESADQIDSAAQRRIAKAWSGMFNGSTKRGKVAVLSGLKYVEVNRLHQDMDFVNLRKMLREEILAAMGVPQSMVGILDQANYSNMKEQTKVFWTQTMIPEIRKFESIMTMRLAQITGDTKTVIQADLSKVEAMRQDEQARANVAQIYVNMGVPLREVVEAFDLPFELKEEPKEPTPTKPAEDEEGGGAKSKAAKLADAREIEWKRFDRDLRPIESGMESKLRSYFRAQGKRVISKFDANANEIVPSDSSKNVKTDEDKVRLIFNFDVEKELLGVTAKPSMRSAYVAFSLRTAQRMRSGIDFNVDERVLGAWIERKVLKLQQEATVYTREVLEDAVVNGVREATAAGLSRSETIDQIRQRIEDFYDFAATGRAERIARTEVVGAANAGSLETMKQLGAVGKEWLTSRDDKVRETHDQLDGVQVGIDDSFLTSDGEQLRFPGDPSAGPAAIINCRCAINPVTEK